MGWTHKKTVVSVVDLFTQIAAIVSVNSGDAIGEKVRFIPATPLHLSSRLSQLASTPEKRFPLIVLVHNFDEVYGADKHGGQINDITLWIMNLAKEKDQFFESRYTENFTPIIDPIYMELMTVIFDSGFFRFPMDVVDPLTDMDYELSRRPDWGFMDGGGNRVNIAGGEFIDGIELKLNLELTEDYVKCFRDSVIALNKTKHNL